MGDVLAGVLAVIGSALVALAGIGVVRFPDLYSRMHAATKAPTLGLLLVAAAAFVVVGEGRGKLILTVALIFVTAPVAAHLVARAAYGATESPARTDADDQLADAIDRRHGAANDPGGQGSSDPPR